MDTFTDKLWLKDLKVIYLSDLKSIKYLKTLLNPDWFSLIVVVSGSIKFNEGSFRIDITAGDLYVIPAVAQVNSFSAPLRICLLSCSIDFAIANRIVRFEINYLEALTTQSSCVLSITSVEIRHIISLFRLLKKMIINKQAVFRDVMVLLCINMIIYEYIELRYRYGKNTVAVHNSNEKIVIRFITLVQQNCVEHHAIKFYADSLYVSKGHLSKAVRSILRMSAKHFIEMALISEAYILLADTNLSITDVGEQLYFDSASSFSTFFKKHTKLTPTQYRLGLKF